MKKILAALFLFLTLSCFGEENYRDLFDRISDLTTDTASDGTSGSNRDASADTAVTGESEDESENVLHKTPPKIGLTASLVGSHIFELHVPVVKDHMNFDGYIKSPKFKNDFGVEVRYKKISLISHWQFDLILNQWGEGEKLLEIIPQENYLSWSPWKFFFAVGFLNYNWGVADKINPTDNLNLKDIREPYDPKSLPSFSVYTRFYPADILSLELIYIPFYLSLPVNPSEYVAEQLSMNSDNISLNGTVAPEYFGMGGKVNLFLRYADFSFSYVTQIDPFYSIDLDLEKIIAPSASYYAIQSAELVNKRVHNLGTDLKASIDIFSIWYELCFTLTEDFLMNSYETRNHQFSWTTGMDFNYGPNSEFYFNFQHFGYYNLGFDKLFYADYDEDSLQLNKNKEYYERLYYRTIVDNLALRREGVVLGAALVMNWPVLNRKITPQIRVVYSLPLDYDMGKEVRYGSLFLKPEIDIMPVDSFHILIGANFYLSWYKPGGENLQIDGGNLTGTNYGSGNIYLTVKYKWGIHFTH